MGAEKRAAFISGSGRNMGAPARRNLRQLDLTSFLTARPIEKTVNR